MPSAVDIAPSDLLLNGVRKRFSRTSAWVLDGVDLHLARSSTTVVVGANGAGKSTLLRIAAGLLLPTSGRVEGRPTAVGYAPDRLGTRPRMSARTYVEHMARVRGFDGASARTRAQEMLERLGLLPGLDAPIRSLSKGNRQKVALAQALLAPVGLLILDEPFGGLDVQARAVVSTVVMERAAQGAVVLISAHAPIEEITTTQILRVARGRLTIETEAARTFVRIVVRAATQDADPATIGACTGVIDAQTDPGARSTTLMVDSTHADAILGFALAHGWSVGSVTPVADPRRRGGA